MIRFCHANADLHASTVPGALLGVDSRAIPMYTRRMIDFQVIWADEVSSTNIWAAEQAEKGAPDGTLYVALRQSSGRGRLERAWQSDGKGLYMTLLLRPDAPPSALSRVPLFAALATCEALKQMGVDALIKWPNDVVARGKKICGILCESRVSGMQTKWCIAGVGINLTQKTDDFQPEIRDTATSLFLELCREVTREQVIGAFLEATARWYPACFEENGTFLQEYRALSATIGRDVRVIEGSEQWTGRALDILPDGALVVETNGITRTVYAGDVSVRGVNGYV